MMKIKKIRLMIILGIITATFSATRVSRAQEYFNPHLLETSETAAPALDLNLFSQEQTPAGDYNVDIYINGELTDAGTFTFRYVEAPDNKRVLLPCVTPEQLRRWNIKVENYPDLAKNGDTYANLLVIPGLSARLVLNQQRFELTIPQLAMAHRARGYVPEDKWDDGITAGLLNYSVSGQTTTSRMNDAVRHSQFVSLLPGMNVGPWRLRNYSTLNIDDGEHQWHSVYSHVSRDIRALKSRLVIGEGNTDAKIFDSVAYTGVSLASDNDMRPDSQQGFAPIVRGIARSDAEVTVYQNGNSIYKTSVPPGPFEIDDIYPTGSAGNLNVTVKESDGSEQSFVVPFASLAVLQREKQLSYSLFAGQTRGDGEAMGSLDFIQSAAAWGVSNALTIYGGVTNAQDAYSSVALGVGMNMGNLGALSVDVTHAKAQLPDRLNPGQMKNSVGQAWRLRYSKSLEQTGTDISVASYRYATSGFYSFQDLINARNSNDISDEQDQAEHRLDVTLSQNTSIGAFSLSLMKERYWNRSQMTSMNLGYGNSWGQISYFLSYARNLNVDQNGEDNTKTNDRLFAFTVNVPFSAFNHKGEFASASMNYSLNSSQHGATMHSLGMSGSALADNSLNWQVQEGYNAANRKTNGNASLNYQSSWGDVSGGYGYDNYTSRYNYALRGGMVAHADGLTFSRTLNESVALVTAPGAKDIPVNGQNNVHTDSQGNAVVPYVRPYHENAISLDDSELAQEADTDIENITKKVVPTRGAVVKAQYQTFSGLKAMLTLTHRGKPVPFGALVTMAGNAGQTAHSDIVGEDGQVYLAGLPQQGQLQVMWGAGSDRQCTVNYSLKPTASTGAIIFQQAACE
ncbi:fimbria/pilus outer membrane usher protein [Cronobacter malonaticus]|nr:fimbria/pilus outer membrane usher protein [Cronobacter malonaticus]MDI7592519.1 fimbria/pilus outer membrane usher protein [Cronobacter malonaticus]MDK1257417.1 fimbria/pilus outer membrane usher protein [Cronobacter malonaticus]MDK1320657.1 fimbria/pilus outer membrane usher protein [Cronobacter malonaticus]CCJ95724.1 type 1 fimbriae anchoring protein FimD [Cronobacter malonaticus 681]